MMARGISAAKNAKVAKTKPSGIPWIGDIPKGWRVMKLKGVLARPLQYGASESGVGYDKALPRYIRITDITLDGKLKDEGALSLTEESALDYILQDQDILLARSGATVGKAFLYEKQMGRAAFAGYLIRATVDVAKALPRFVYYTTLGCGYDDWRNSIAVSATIQNIGADKYNNYSLPIPSIAEQKAIADYLDEKCAAIDAAVAEAKKGIEEYKAWKKSLIFEAVNGEWKKRRLRFLADITTGNKDTQDAEPEGAYPFYVRSPIVERSSSYTFEGPGILMAGDGAGAGRVFHYAEGKYAVHQRVYRIYNFRGIEGRFLLYSLGAIFPLEMDKGSAQSTVPSVRLPMLKDLLIPLPPLAEQKAIADYLDEKCAAIDALVAEKEALIADFEAYKKSLIYETVTGKREVA